MKPTARLENWYRDPFHSIIWGKIYDDIHGRWPNGTTIHTSYINFTLENRAEEGRLIATRNSVYLLGSPRQENKI